MRGEPGYVFLVGAPKAGTTSIAGWLGAQDAVAASAIKEPRFFTDFGARTWTGPDAVRFRARLVTDRAAYEALFRTTGATRWKLDASTDYLSCPASPGLIGAFADRHDVRVIAVLRDPVERIVSEFQHTLRDGWQAGTLRASLDAEAERTAAGRTPLFHHTARSRYAGPVADYAARFGDRFLVLDYHALGDGDGTWRRIAAFLGIAYEAGADNEPRANEGHVPRSALLTRALRSAPLREAARAVVPAPLRRRVWQTAVEANKTRYRATEVELDHLRGLLADEIAACVADPRIPTENWRTAIPAH